MTEQEKYIADALAQVRRNMAAAAQTAGRRPGDVLLCAASKTQDADTVRFAAALDIDIFGENRVQELTAKNAAGAYLGKPLHLIGHLQTNKVRQVVGTAVMIQSVDSVRLLDAIDAQAARCGLCQDILLEVNIGGELSKSGVAPEQLDGLAEHAEALGHVRVRGLMTIPPAAQTEPESRRYFARMYQLYRALGERGYSRVQMEYLSMGMSGDYESAILEGANMVRVGTALFGQRSYPVR